MKELPIVISAICALAFCIGWSKVGEGRVAETRDTQAGATRAGAAKVIAKTPAIKHAGAGAETTSTMRASAMPAPTTTVKVMARRIRPEAAPRTRKGRKQTALLASQPEFVKHRVAPGESLTRIARRYDTNIAELRKQNGIRGGRVKPGTQLRIIPGLGSKLRLRAGQSVGVPQRGKLLGGRQLPRGRGYYRRRPHRAYGANHLIYHVRRMVRAVRAEHPGLHTLAIGDISSQRGGHVGEHKSHQSGRDIDIGLYYRKIPAGYPETFVTTTEDNLDFAATWSMLKVFADTAKTPGGVKRIYLDYELQELLYEWAVKNNKADLETLNWMFQYPSPREQRRGLIRDDPGHNSHIHVRFKCPKNDKKCRW